MSRKVFVLDKEFELFIPAPDIDNTVSKIAGEINRDYESKNPLFLCVLNGAFIFAADLLRKITIPCTVSFVKYSSYSGTQSTQYVKKLIGLSEELSGRNVIVVEDIIDTGITMEELLKEIREKRPASVRIAAFCFKPEAFRKSFGIDYLGMEIPNEFVVGYGLDYNGYGRNLEGIYKILKF